MNEDFNLESASPELKSLYLDLVQKNLNLKEELLLQSKENQPQFLAGKVEELRRLYKEALGELDFRNIVISNLDDRVEELEDQVDILLWLYAEQKHWNDQRVLDSWVNPFGHPEVSLDENQEFWIGHFKSGQISLYADPGILHETWMRGVLAQTIAIEGGYLTKEMKKHFGGNFD